MPDPAEPRTMRPEDVPDELVALAWRAELARRAPEASAALVEEYCDLEAHPSIASQREELRPVLAAVHPEIERQVLSEIRDLWHAWQEADRRRELARENGQRDHAVLEAATRSRFELERAIGVEIPEIQLKLARDLGWEKP